MQRNMDTIQFESRAEVGKILDALQEWQKSQKEKDEVVQEMIDKLDVMEMEW